MSLGVLPGNSPSKAQWRSQSRSCRVWPRASVRSHHLPEPKGQIPVGTLSTAASASPGSPGEGRGSLDKHSFRIADTPSGFRYSPRSLEVIETCEVILIRDLIVLQTIPCSRSFFPCSLRPLNIRLQCQVYVIWCLMYLTTSPEQLN